MSKGTSLTYQDQKKAGAVSQGSLTPLTSRGIITITCERNRDRDVDPVEIKIEIFGLGRYMGKHEESSNITVPLDIIELIANRYDMKEEELIRIYSKDVLDSGRDKQE